MQTAPFFTQLLGLSAPFSISSVIYEDQGLASQSVHIHISVDTSLNYRPENTPIKDYQERTWQHLHLFQYPCYIHRKVPKYEHKNTKKVETLAVPWANTGAGFPLLFEAYAIELVKIYGCVAEVAQELKIYPQRLWHITETQGKKTLREELKDKKMHKIGVDETSQKKGPSYITSFMDLETGELLYVVEGKDVATVHKFAEASNLDTKDSKEISIDMSPAFIAGAKAVFTEAKITVDKFHVSQLGQKAFDSIRKYMRRKEKRTIHKGLFFKEYQELTREEKQLVDDLLLKYPLLDKVYQLKNNFQNLWKQEDKLQASAFLSYWTDAIREFKKKALTTLANTLDKHHQKIIEVIDSKITNAILEGFNAKVQTMKKKQEDIKMSIISY